MDKYNKGQIIMVNGKKYEVAQCGAGIVVAIDLTSKNRKLVSFDMRKEKIETKMGGAYVVKGAGHIMK